ncbi:P-loop NTPase fold protein [uncultured Draconibacterium sp.]|uniref:KAP family P-loop NTPase fold protein n=1 Tax=uncultured Draconibacterium sp. TaxID=1573823 RepID=UPI003216AEFC
MHLRHNDLIPDPQNPFSACKLNREQYANVLTEIVKTYKDGFVLAIDNKWGTGKTTFVKMWKQQLENEDFKTLYFNAWENDFEQDILVTVISELKGLLSSTNKATFNKLLDNAVPLTKSLALGLLKTQIEKHVGNDFAKDLLNTASSSILDGLQERIKSYTAQKNGIVEFRKSLEKFASITSKDKPVVFIIDELDRCRPNYAVELLEQIKHLFSVPGIVFVLSIDKIQLGNAVRGLYGSDLIDANEYLRRFIDIEYSIPEPELSVFVEYLYQYFQFDEFFSFKERLNYDRLRKDKSEFIEFASLLFNYNRITLRVQEKIFAHSRLALLQFSSNHFVIPSLFILLVYLKLTKVNIYKGIKDHKYSFQELLDEVESVLPQNIDEDNISMFLYAISRLLKSYNKAKERYEQKPIIEKNKESSELRLLIKSKLDKSENNKELASFCDESRYYNEMDNMSINHLITKIDLTEKIIIN